MLSLDKFVNSIPFFLRPYALQFILLAQENPVHVGIEIFLVTFIAYILFVKRSYNPLKRGYGGRPPVTLSAAEKKELIAEWVPEPIVPEGDGSKYRHPTVLYTIDKYDDKNHNKVIVTGSESTKTAFTSLDFFGLSTDAEMKRTATETLNKYTVGTCGPRGFYGTTDLHLALEDRLASFFNTEGAIIYSDATVTSASAIPAFAKRNDLLLVDAGVNFGLHMGSQLSRSKIIYFKHNDVDDLRKHLEDVRKADKTKLDISLTQRRFIVLEGLYEHTGDIAPLDKIYALAKEFKWRIMLDDTHAVGVLGKTGRGSIEHFAPKGEKTLKIDILMGSMATVMSSVGGYCVGSKDVISHQRLSGSGYVFSASSPAFTVAVARNAIDILDRDSSLTEAVRAKARQAHKMLAVLSPWYINSSDEVSPVKHLSFTPEIVRRLTDSPSSLRIGGDQFLKMLSPTTQTAPVKDKTQEEIYRELNSYLDDIIMLALSRNVVISRTHALNAEPFTPIPALKICFNIKHTDIDIDNLVQVLTEVTKTIVN